MIIQISEYARPKPFPSFKKYCLGIKGFERNDWSVLCGWCKGNGTAYDFSDRCPIAGYKMASKKTCTECDGSGRQYSSKKAMKKDWRELQQARKRHIQEWKYNQEALEVLRKRLSKDAKKYFEIF